jgi:hypothetical protein
MLFVLNALEHECEAGGLALPNRDSDGQSDRMVRELAQAERNPNLPKAGQ